MLPSVVTQMTDVGLHVRSCATCCRANTIDYRSSNRFYLSTSSPVKSTYYFRNETEVNTN